MAAAEVVRRQELEHLAALEAARRAEVERIAAAEAARRQEIERLAAEEAARRAEIERVAAEEATRRQQADQRAAELAASAQESSPVEPVAVDLDSSAAGSTDAASEDATVHYPWQVEAPAVLDLGGAATWDPSLYGDEPVPEPEPKRSPLRRLLRPPRPGPALSTADDELASIPDAELSSPTPLPEDLSADPGLAEVAVGEALVEDAPVSGVTDEDASRAEGGRAGSGARGSRAGRSGTGRGRAGPRPSRLAAELAAAPVDRPGPRPGPKVEPMLPALLARTAAAEAVVTSPAPVADDEPQKAAPKVKLGKLFRRKNELDGTPTWSYPGQSLGLPLARAISRDRHRRHRAGRGGCRR